MKLNFVDWFLAKNQIDFCDIYSSFVLSHTVIQEMDQTVGSAYFLPEKYHSSEKKIMSNLTKSHYEILLASEDCDLETF